MQVRIRENYRCAISQHLDGSYLEHLLRRGRTEDIPPIPAAILDVCYIIPPTVMDILANGDSTDTVRLHISAFCLSFSSGWFPDHRSVQPETILTGHVSKVDRVPGQKDTGPKNKRRHQRHVHDQNELPSLRRVQALLRCYP